MPAGHAILAALTDSIIATAAKIRVMHLSSALGRLPYFKLMKTSPRSRILPPVSVYSIHTNTQIASAHDSGIDLIFTQNIEDAFSKLLGEDLSYDVRTVVNELMQNTVDHSGAERYYLYAGIWENDFHVGVLDMGFTIPARLERKYRIANDVESLELALRKGIGTRQTREGGLGLSYVRDIVKRNEGRLTILSRQAQFRKYFSTRRSQRSLLKRPVDGTWVFVRFPMRRV
ncbi:MAG TPA: ATP-binding protein [Bdellovibrionota bacterium]|nr:ATP-binding protein [Bdellovibrionota bacterium]